MKNLAIMGGLLVVFARGPGRYAIERPAFWAVGLVALALLGDGTAALGPMLGLNW